MGKTQRASWTFVTLHDVLQAAYYDLGASPLDTTCSIRILCMQPLRLSFVQEGKFDVQSSLLCLLLVSVMPASNNPQVSGASKDIQRIHDFQETSKPGQTLFDWPVMTDWTSKNPFVGVVSQKNLGHMPVEDRISSMYQKIGKVPSNQQPSKPQDVPLSDLYTSLEGQQIRNHI